MKTEASQTFIKQDDFEIFLKNCNSNIFVSIWLKKELKNLKLFFLHSMNEMPFKHKLAYTFQR